jgi:hypothetical protein
MRRLNISRNKILAIILILVWTDIGLTYMGLLKLKESDPANWMNHEISFSVGPLIKHFGLEPGLMIGGVINSFLIMSIAILFPIEFTHGIITGIFILAFAINLRLLIGL